MLLCRQVGEELIFGVTGVWGCERCAEIKGRHVKPGAIFCNTANPIPGQHPTATATLQAWAFVSGMFEAKKQNRCCMVLYCRSLQRQVRQDSVRRSFRWSIEEIKARRVADLQHSLFLSEVSSLYWRSLRLAGNLVMSYSLHLPSSPFNSILFCHFCLARKHRQMPASGMCDDPRACDWCGTQRTNSSTQVQMSWLGGKTVLKRLKALLPKVWCPQRMLRVRTRNV